MICRHHKGLDGRRGDPWVPFMFLGKQEGWAHQSCERAWRERLLEQRAKEAAFERKNRIKRFAFDVKLFALDWSHQRKSYALVIFTGLVVSWVRQGLQHHFQKGFPSWGDFFASWFVTTLAVAVVSGIAAFAIHSTHRFFVGSEYEDGFDRLFFYTVMTVLVCALLIAFGATSGSPDWEPW